MEFARRAAAARADADDIYGMPIPSPEGNGNMELVLCLHLCWNLEPVEVLVLRRKGIFFVRGEERIF